MSVCLVRGMVRGGPAAAIASVRETVDVHNEVPRPLTEAEQSVLNRLLSPDFDGVDALPAQAQGVRVVGHCGADARQSLCRRRLMPRGPLGCHLGSHRSRAGSSRPARRLPVRSSCSSTTGG